MAIRTINLSLIFETIWLGLNNLRLHKLRSALTALGIIFGVAAVICMLSISEGASADEMRLIQLLGTRNIIVNSVKPQGPVQASDETTYMLDYGVTHDDYKLIEATVPHVNALIPLKEVANAVQYQDKKIEWPVLGTTPEFFTAVNVSVARGRAITDLDMHDNKQVCVIGSAVVDELFAYEDPIGKSVYAQSAFGIQPFRIVGVLDQVITAGAPARDVQDRNLNRETYIPYSTAKSQYGSISRRQSSGSRETFKVDYTSLYVNVADINRVLPVSGMVARILERNHDDKDYEVRVPLARLRLAQQKERNKKVMLGLIAGISLVVGGIGIMNIMLATVTMRTREIGIRRALGAKQRHITVQFLVEAVVLSTTGGLLGVALGWLSAHSINRFANWDTIIEPWTIIVSFTLSALVGIFFGMYPAITAAKLDPIEALRHE